jgi:hypothetical protein
MSMLNHSMKVCEGFCAMHRDDNHGGEYTCVV